MFSSVQLSSSFSLACGVVSGHSSSLTLHLNCSIKRAPRFELPCCGKRLANVSTLTSRSLSTVALLVSFRYELTSAPSRATIGCLSEAESEIPLAPRLDALALGRLDASALWLS
jgi:hypothetical protein